MRIDEMISALSLRPLSLPEPEREIQGAYVGDLLSWVLCLGVGMFVRTRPLGPSKLCGSLGCRGHVLTLVSWLAEAPT